MDSFLEQKQVTHGPFKEYAHVAQRLKEICSPHTPDSPKLKRPEYMNEGLDMILGKIARIVAGGPMEPDHWKDIQGYARCVEKELLVNDVSAKPEEAKKGVIR